MKFFMENRTFILVMFFGILTFIAFFFTKRLDGAVLGTIISVIFAGWSAKRTMESYKGKSNDQPSE